MSTSEYLVKLNTVKNSCANCSAGDFCLSANLSIDQLDDFDGLVGHQRPIPRGQYIFRAGDDFDSIYVVKSGSVKTFVDSIDGEQQVTGFHFPGDILGADGIETGTHTYSVETLETSYVCELNFDQFEDMAVKVPLLQQRLLCSMSKQISREHEMMLLLGKLQSDRRLAIFIVDISERMEQRSRSAYSLHLSMTRHEIANYLGLAVETISRALTRFQKEGLLEVKGRSVLIKNYDGLQRLAVGSDLDPRLARQQG